MQAASVVVLFVFLLDYMQMARLTNTLFLGCIFDFWHTKVHLLKEAEVRRKKKQQEEQAKGGYTSLNTMTNPAATATESDRSAFCEKCHGSQRLAAGLKSVRRVTTSGMSSNCVSNV